MDTSVRYEDLHGWYHCPADKSRDHLFFGMLRGEQVCFYNDGKGLSSFGFKYPDLGNIEDYKSLIEEHHRNNYNSHYFITRDMDGERGFNKWYFENHKNAIVKYEGPNKHCVESKVAVPEPKVEDRIIHRQPLNCPCDRVVIAAGTKDNYDDAFQREIDKADAAGRLIVASMHREYPGQLCQEVNWKTRTLDFYFAKK